MVSSNDILYYMCNASVEIYGSVNDINERTEMYYLRSTDKRIIKKIYI